MAGDYQTEHKASLDEILLSIHYQDYLALFEEAIRFVTESAAS